MEISLSKGVWTLSNLRATEFDLLCAVPSAADPTGCEAAQNRLFPPPLRHPTPGDAEFLQEWHSFVTGDLATQFSEDIITFSNDLTRASVTGSDEDGKPLRSLEIPVSHAQRWFSALNQARLVLADVFHIYDDEGHISPRENEDFADFHKRWRHYVQSNFYAAIQEWLIVHILPDL